jgi:hypothetical protein
MPRACACDHGFPLCCCLEGARGGELLRRSRLASAAAGWPGPLEADRVAAHEARIRGAATARRAAKPRVPLGARPAPPADCARPKG